MLETFFYIIKCFTHWKIPSLTPFILITISCFDSYIHSVQNYLLLSKYPYTYPSFKPSMNMSSYFWTCYLEEIYMWDSGNWDRPKGIPWMRRWHVYVLYTFWGQKDYLLSHLLKAHEVSSLHFFCYFSLCKLLLLAKNSSVNHEPGKESYTMFPGKKDLKKSKSSSVENAKVEILPIRKTLGIVGKHVVVQSLSPVWFFATPWTVAHHASLSFTISWSLPKLMSVDSVMPPNHFILCHPLLPLPSLIAHFSVITIENSLARAISMSSTLISLQEKCSWFFTGLMLVEQIFNCACRIES